MRVDSQKRIFTEPCFPISEYQLQVYATLQLGALDARLPVQTRMIRPLAHTAFFDISRVTSPEGQSSLHRHLVFFCCTLLPSSSAFFVLTRRTPEFVRRAPPSTSNCFFSHRASCLALQERKIAQLRICCTISIHGLSDFSFSSSTKANTEDTDRESRDVKSVAKHNCSWTQSFFAEFSL